MMRIGPKYLTNQYVVCAATVTVKVSNLLKSSSPLLCTSSNKLHEKDEPLATSILVLNRSDITIIFIHLY